MKRHREAGDSYTEKLDSKEIYKPEVETLLVNDQNLRKVPRKRSFAEYIRETYKLRHFIGLHARTSAFGTTRGTILGKLWLLIDPLLQVSVYAVVFGLILNTSRGIDNFLGFLTIGVVFFKFLSGGINNGSKLIQRNRGLVNSFNFPRITIPIGVTIRSFLDNLVPAVVAIIVALAFQFGKPLSFSLIMVPALYFLIHIWNAGATMIVARITAFIPDFASLIRVIVQALFFISGVFFSLARFDGQPVIQRIVEFNPLYQFLTAVRICTLEGSFPSAPLITSIVLWSLGTFTFGVFFFWSAEGRYAKVK